MKIIGIIIVIICFIFNVFVGLVLFGSSLPDTESVESSIFEETTYDDYGFAIKIPDNFESGGSNISKNLLEVFFDSITLEEYAPEIYIYVYGDKQEGNITSSEEYRIVNENDFLLNTAPEGRLEYEDGGIAENMSGIKYYYDVVSVTSNSVRFRQKAVSFFHNGNMIVVWYIDDASGFGSTVSDFDKIVDSIRVY